MDEARESCAVVGWTSLRVRVVWCLIAIIASCLIVDSSVHAQTNVAAHANGGVASASTAYHATFGTTTYSFPPGGAIDGDRRGVNWGFGGGWNDTTPNAFPDWLQVNFKGMHAIGEIGVFTLQDNFGTANPTPEMTFTLSGVTDFQVQYWNGAAWVNVPGGNITGNKLVWRRLTFAPITTDRIRVVVNAALENYSRIVELEAWTAAPGAPLPNVAPTVTLNAPQNNTMLTAPATVTLSAAATDVDGSVSKVEFYRNGGLIATVTTPTSGAYVHNDTSVGAGTYSYTARVYDNASPSAATTSGERLVSVSALPAGAVNVAAQANGGVAVASSAFAATYGATTYTFPPGGAINGDRRGVNWGFGGGWNDMTPGAFPDWLQVNFKGSYAIGEISVFTLQDNFATLNPTPGMTFTLSGLTDFQVQYWNGSAWVDVPGGNVTGNNLVWRRFAFAPITTDRIRVVVNGALENYSRIVELEAWTSPTAQPSQQQAYYIHTDHLNTPRVITNTAGQAVWRWDNLDPFGVNAPDENPSGVGTFTCNLRFPGQYFDRETKLHYNYFRDYDPWIGRYVQSDPIGLDGGINTYAYVSGNPLALVDPIGLKGCGAGLFEPIIPNNPRGFPFEGCCDAHDDCYEDCKSRPTKLECDVRFWDCLISKCRKYLGAVRIRCENLAGHYAAGAGNTARAQKSFEESRAKCRNCSSKP